MSTATGYDAASAAAVAAASEVWEAADLSTLSGESFDSVWESAFSAASEAGLTIDPKFSREDASRCTRSAYINAVTEALSPEESAALMSRILEATRSSPTQQIPAESQPSTSTTSTTDAGEVRVSKNSAIGTRRVNVNFSDQAYRTLEALATRTGRSMSDVLRDAIALKSWFEQTRAEGGHVLVELPNGKVREVISV